MGLLYSLRNELGDTTGTPLELWVKRQGSRSIQKFKHLTAENGFTGPVPYKLESEYDISKAYIDKRHVLSMVDKLSQVDFYLSRLITKLTKWLCAQRRLRSAWASAQSDQSLLCALNG